MVLKEESLVKGYGISGLGVVGSGGTRVEDFQGFRVHSLED